MISRTLTALVFGTALSLSLSNGPALAGGSALKTKAQLPVAGNGIPGGENEVPSFATLDALDKYYNAADSGQCNDECLAAVWLKLGTQSKVTLLDNGMTVWVLRRQTDPASPSYHVCRVFYYAPGTSTGINAWVLCSNLAGEPAF